MTPKARWWHQTTIYQVYPRSFFDSNGDGIGDLAGITAKLDYIRDLGFETLWVSPFFASPQVDFGYDITDYLSVASEYGDMAAAENLIEEAHRRGMKVMFDLVMNHTSDQHPWFVESRSSRNNPKADWYIWADGKGRGKPNNWRAINVITSAWKYDPVRGQYFLASFLPCQPDLNYNHPEVRETMLNVVRYWLRKGVDGFRLDMFGYIGKDRELRNNPFNPRPGFVPGMPAPEIFIQKYNTNTLDSIAFAKELRKVCQEFEDPERILLGEVYGTSDVLKPYLGDDDGLQLVFLFDFLSYKYSADFFRQRIANYERDFAFPQQPTYVLSNHDRTRSLTRVKDDVRKARVLATMLLTVRGVPTVYMGEEIGMTNTPLRAADSKDVLARSLSFLPEFMFQLLQRILKETLNRDEVRTPMQWNGSTHAGFCRDDVRPWLPVNDNKNERSVAANEKDRASLLHLHRALLHLRRAEPALHRGSLDFLPDTPPGVLAYRREADGRIFSIYLNLTDKLQHLESPPGQQIVIATNPDDHAEAGELSLHPHTAVVLGPL